MAEKELCAELENRKATISDEVTELLAWASSISGMFMRTLNQLKISKSRATSVGQEFVKESEKLVEEWSSIGEVTSRFSVHLIRLLT